MHENDRDYDAENPGRKASRVFCLDSDERFVAAALAEQRSSVEALDPDCREPWIRLLEADPRVGRQRLALQLRRQMKRSARVEARWRELSDFDLREADKGLLAGVDEVGRGPLAGPVSAAALILPAGYHAPGLDDSKRLSRGAREHWSEQLRRDAVAWAVADVAAETIDSIGIRRATFAAMGSALDALNVAPARVIVDGNDTIPSVRNCSAVVGGDRRSLAIAGASVIAKVHRDALMRDLDERWPDYGFASNKGYGSSDHCQTLLELGPCPLHRRSFCARFIRNAGEEGEERGTGAAG